MKWWLLVVSIGCSGRSNDDATRAVPPAANRGHFAIAEFSGTQLVACHEASASMNGHGAIDAQQVSLVLADEVRVAQDPMAHSILRDVGAPGMTEQVVGLIGQTKQSEIDAYKENIRWPTKKVAARAASGDLSRVDACPIEPIELGTCELHDVAPQLTWAMMEHRYDRETTRDSSASMKNCLAFGGRWFVMPPGEAAPRLR